MYYEYTGAGKSFPVTDMNTRTLIRFLITVAVYNISLCHGLIGFDCGGHQLNVTTISLLGAGECDLKIQTPTKKETYIQLLQLSEYNYAEVIQCKVETHRIVFYCGMHSHISMVRGGVGDYLEETTYEKCLQMHQHGSIDMGFEKDSRIRNLKPNRTSVHAVTIAGELYPDGKCKGIQYADNYGSWTDVVVQGTVKITLKTAYVPVNLNTGHIHLKSGTTCLLKDGFCMDADDGYTFWKTAPTSACDFHHYDVLYEGLATKIKDETSLQPVVYSLNTNDITFALTASRQHPMCGYTLLQTEHPKLFIVETTKGNAPKPRSDIPVDNLDIFTYVNSKFVYVEKHIRNQMTTLYHNVMQQRCELESEVLRNTLSFATLLPDEFAYRLMKGPGYMAVAAGEAIHIVKCIPVEVLARRTDTCYQELPVQKGNVSFYLTPKSRILTKIGTQRECSHELPTLYRIEDIWVEFLPVPHISSMPPQQLRPLAKISWKYITPAPLADSGIYSSQDINKLRDHIMFPAEKPALLNSVARGVNGYSMGGHHIPLQHLLDEDALEKIAQSTAARLWGGFVTFGSATAGVLGIFIIIRVIKIIIDTAIHGYALHTVYGCSLHLLGAIWSSLTHLLLHLAHPPINKKKKHSTADATADNAVDPEEQPIPAERHNNQIITEQPGPSAPEISIYPSLGVNYKPSKEYLALSKRLDELDKINP